MKPVTLHTERLELRPFAAADADALHAICQDPDILRFTPTPDPFTREEAERSVRQALASWDDDSCYELAVCRKDTAELIGGCSIQHVMKGVYEVGYWAAPEQRRQGFLFEAAQAMCAWAWDTLDMHRLEWWAVVGNTASRALAEKLGFEVEGVLRNRGIMGGQPRDWWVGAQPPR